MVQAQTPRIGAIDHVRSSIQPRHTIIGSSESLSTSDGAAAAAISAFGNLAWAVTLIEMRKAGDTEGGQGVLGVCVGMNDGYGKWNSEREAPQTMLLETVLVVSR